MIDFYCFIDIYNATDEYNPAGIVGGRRGEGGKLLRVSDHIWPA